MQKLIICSKYLGVSPSEREPAPRYVFVVKRLLEPFHGDVGVEYGDLEIAVPLYRYVGYGCPQWQRSPFRVLMSSGADHHQWCDAPISTRQSRHTHAKVCTTVLITRAFDQIRQHVHRRIFCTTGGEKKYFPFFIMK